MKSTVTRIFFAASMICLGLLNSQRVHGQQMVRGSVKDAASNEALPFATIKAGNSGQGTITDLNGAFDLTVPAGTEYIEAHYLGYESKKVAIGQGNALLEIKLTAKEQALGEVVIKSPEEKIRRILNLAINNRDRNNPEKYDWYRCKVYYKLLADVNYDIADSLVA